MAANTPAAAQPPRDIVLVDLGCKAVARTAHLPGASWIACSKFPGCASMEFRYFSGAMNAVVMATVTPRRTRRRTGCARKVLEACFGRRAAQPLRRGPFEILTGLWTWITPRLFSHDLTSRSFRL